MYYYDRHHREPPGRKCFDNCMKVTTSLGVCSVLVGAVLWICSLEGTDDPVIEEGVNKYGIILDVLVLAIVSCIAI